MSKRTFTRDLDEIADIYGIYIKYDFSARNYMIEDDFSDMVINRRLEALDVFSALQMKERQKDNLFLDTRQRAGTEHLYGLLHAVNNRLQISFDYQKFYADEKDLKTVNPLAIKEFKYRWYLWAQTLIHKNIVCFAFDRMSNLQILQTNFDLHADFDLAERLHYCFGIICPDDERPSEVILSFEAFQGQYIKSLPLHHTQQVLIDNTDELRISLTVYLTHDFQMELLSYGSTVKVIQPQELIDKMKNSYENSLKRYLK